MKNKTHSFPFCDCLNFQLPEMGGEIYPFFEPIWLSDGKLFALEMLSRFEPKTFSREDSVNFNFTNLPQPLQISIFKWQLEIFYNLRLWFKKNNVSVSINVTREQSIGVYDSPSLRNLLYNLKSSIYLEVNECFFDDKTSLHTDKALSLLHLTSRLWLDDFGIGNSGLSSLMCNKFVGYKLDRSIFGWLSIQDDGMSFLKELCNLVHRNRAILIAEGVADEKLRQFSCRAGVHACQGWRWKGVKTSSLVNIPSILPKWQTASFL